MKKHRRPRVFMGLMEISGYYHNLQKGFGELGVKSVFLQRSLSVYEYGDDFNNNYLVSLWRKSYKSLRDERLRGLRHYFWLSIYFVLTVFLIVWVTAAFNIFIFGCGSTFLGYRELKILRLFRKKIIFVYHGTDSRPPYLNGKYHAYSPEEVIRISRKMKGDLRKVEALSDFVVCNPPQGHFFEKKFINRLYLGSPINFSYARAKNSKKEDGSKLRIVHMPTDPENKGTKLVREAVSNLKDGDFEYRELKNLTNSQVMEEVVAADIVIDQVYSDFFVTGTMREASCLGKPTVISGYYASYYKNDYREDIPAAISLPSQLQQSIESLIKNKRRRIKLGEEAKKYMASEGSPENVAKNFLRLVNGDVPKHWYYDPYDIKYIYGYGSSKLRLKKFLKGMIEIGGWESMQLSDKPQILSAFKNFLEESS